MSSDLANVAGVFVASRFSKWSIRVSAGPVASASPATLNLTNGVIALRDGFQMNPFAISGIVSVGTGANQETVTLTGFANCFNGAGPGVPTITGNTSNSHGVGDQVSTASCGLFEACLAASNAGGGVVVIDSECTASSANIAAAKALYPTISIQDNRNATDEIQTTVTTLTSAQLKALQTTAIQLAPPPGAGFVLIPRLLVLDYVYLTTAYTIANSDNVFTLEYTGKSTALIAPAATGLVDQTASFVIFQAPAVANAAISKANSANLGLEVKLTGSSPALTSGLGSVVATLEYNIVAVS